MLIWAKLLMSQDVLKGRQWLHWGVLGLVSALLSSLVSPAGAVTVALDVGHSLVHPGATSARGVWEFTFNRALAFVVRHMLEQQSFQVRLIGAQGDMQDLRARTHAAAGTDFFLSLHHDSVQPQYLETWVPEGIPRRFSDRFSGFSPFVSRSNPHRPPVSSALRGLAQPCRTPASYPLHAAEPIPGENRQFADRTNGVYYFDDLVVLKTATQPALLLEAGIIINRVDELALQQQTVREKIAAAIAAALDVCLRVQPISARPSGE